MKHDDKNELSGMIISGVIALVSFVVLLMLMKWNIFLSMGLSVAIYIAFSLMLKPVDRIGSVEISTLNNGEMLHERLKEAGSDYNRMKKAALKVRDAGLQKQCNELLIIAQSILKYLTDHPEKITSARRYIDYYQETAANLIEHYAVFQDKKWWILVWWKLAPIPICFIIWIVAAVISLLVE